VERSGDEGLDGLDGLDGLASNGRGMVERRRSHHDHRIAR